ncbi:hypothetical protein EDC01DRAFT_780242 [Geopyxis carbonaria]|nr:hypothetical protein EDC01DRAFT_780242 [Geopyxis carbonaria]
MKLTASLVLVAALCLFGRSSAAPVPEPKRVFRPEKYGMGYKNRPTMNFPNFQPTRFSDMALHGIRIPPGHPDDVDKVDEVEPWNNDDEVEPACALLTNPAVIAARLAEFPTARPTAPTSGSSAEAAEGGTGAASEGAESGVREGGAGCEDVVLRGWRGGGHIKCFGSAIEEVKK